MSEFKETFVRVDSEASDYIESLPEFTDIYVHLDSIFEQSFIWPGPQKMPKELYGLAEHVKKKNVDKKEKDFRITYHGHKFRAHRTNTLGGDYVVLRRMPMEVWTLERCRIHKSIRSNLLADRLNVGGLVIVCGKPGNGKSTTCSAIITERLKKFGGLCMTIEDPAEMPLHGQWGNGICLQREVLYEDFPDAIRDAMRAYPTGVQTQMLIGEIRDPDTAALALQSAVDGRLVLTTTHSGSVIQGIHRILSLASTKLGEMEARHLLASSFRFSVHQQLVRGKLNMQMLMDTASVAGKIMTGESLEQLKNDLRLQMNNLKLGKVTELRKTN